MTMKGIYGQKYVYIYIYTQNKTDQESIIPPTPGSPGVANTINN